MSNEDSFLHLVKCTYPQMIAAITGTLFAISDGMTYGWSAPYIPYLISDVSHIKTSKHEAELLETFFLLGSFCGLPLTIYLVDKIGRKKSLLLASLVVLLAWIAIALGNNMIYIFVARFFCGMCGNMAFVAAPCYIAEIADSRIRGFLSSIIYVMMLLGCLIVYCVGPYLPFYVPSIIGGTVCLIELLVFSRVPESAMYLLSKNRPEEALESIKYFKSYCETTKELDDIKAVLEKQQNEKGNFLDLFKVTSNRKGIVIMTVLNAGQHLCAYSVILMNLHSILEAAGSIYMDHNHAAILFAALMLLAVIFASLQIDNYGRKALLIFSSILTGICLLSIAIYFNLKEYDYDVLSASWIPIVSIMVYALVFKVGVGIVPIVVTAEIFPTNLKAIGMTLSDAMFIVGGLIAINLYQSIANNFGIFIPFYIFGAFAIFITFFTIFFVPETKGKSLDEIQSILKGEKPNSKTYTLENTASVNF
ncbi:facilitated trehalose transporter Tret1-like [Diorhabda carinulata]|uniref:facilitated trehalose transporter Tret1-like n=1 Tax=Diorhabda carinulata TaxID=1163345 RepID=UPI0025A192F2|nr:facilitated trehalose transporter Tret1-like [Diorhabda carinulata]